MKPNEWTVRARLTLAFGTLAVLVLLVAGMGLYEMSAANARLRDYVDGVDARTRMAFSVRAAIDQRALAVRNLVLTTSDADRDAQRLVAERAHREATERLAQLVEMGRAPDVSQRARDLIARIAQISAATREQTSGIGQVGTAVSQLDTVTQQNAALVEESAAAAESLRHQAEGLSELVRRFRLERAGV